MTGAYEELVAQGTEQSEGARGAGGAVPLNVFRQDEEAADAEDATIIEDEWCSDDGAFDANPTPTPAVPPTGNDTRDTPRATRTTNTGDLDAQQDPFQWLSLPNYDDQHFADGRMALRGDRAADQAWVAACVAAHADRVELINKLETVSGVRAHIGSPTALSWRLFAACFARRRAAILSQRLGKFYRHTKRRLKGAPGKKKRLRKTMAADIGVSERKLRKLLSGEWSARASEAETASKIVGYLNREEKAREEEEEKKKRRKRRRQQLRKTTSTEKMTRLGHAPQEEEQQQQEEEEFVPSNLL